MGMRRFGLLKEGMRAWYRRNCARKLTTTPLNGLAIRILVRPASQRRRTPRWLQALSNLLRSCGAGETGIHRRDLEQGKRRPEPSGKPPSSGLQFDPAQSEL